MRCDNLAMDSESSDEELTKSTQQDLNESLTASESEVSEDSEDDNTNKEPKPKRQRNTSSETDDEYVYLNHGSEWTQFGPSDGIKDVITPMEIFANLISDELIDIVVNNTNRAIQIKKVQYKKECKTVTKTNAKEMKALLGLLIQTAATRSNHLPLSFLFNTKYSGSIYKATMSIERCQFLLRSLKFCNNTKKESILSEFWGLFVDNCKKCYVPGNFVTAGEHMLPYRGRCPYNTYSGKHKCRYGVKFMVLLDVCSKYIINVLPDIDLNTNTKKSLNSNLLKQLSQHLYGSNRNLTIANTFVSVPLAKLFLESSYKLTVVGALKSKIPNKSSQPEDSERQNAETSTFGFGESMKLLSYKPSENKRQFILSTLHNQPSSNDKFGSIDLLQFFNKTKGVLDDAWKTRAKYTLNRRTDSWETHIFYFMLDIALMNMYIIYISNMHRKSEKCLNRRDLMLSLSEQLMIPWLEDRHTNRYLPRFTKVIIADMLGKEVQSPPAGICPTSSADTSKFVRRSCGYCPSRLRRMTRHYCKGCNKPICGLHNINMCHICAEALGIV